MTIQWTKEACPGTDQPIYRGDGSDVEWTVMPQHGEHIRNCEVKIANLSARALLESDEYRVNLAQIEKLRRQGKAREAHRLHNLTTLFNRDFIVTGSQAEGLAIAEAFEKDNSSDARVAQLLAKAGFAFSYRLHNGTMMFHRPVRSGSFSIAISRNSVALHYDPPQSRFTYTVFRVRLDDSSNVDRRLKTLWPKNVRFPLRKAISTAVMLADLRAKLKRPSQPLTAEAFKSA